MYENRRVIGILAHVDAGKTTLAEAFLYKSGVLRELGRVDHQDAFLDNFAQERARGITIFSKQARFTWKDTEITILDTPGHVDFSGEMERTLRVLDYAVLVVSGADGVQGHTRTLWGLLRRYGIPTFLFVNKMDQEGTDREALLGELREKLDESCVDFSEEKFRGAEVLPGETEGASEKEKASGRESKASAEAAGQKEGGSPAPSVFYDDLALCGEVLLEEYLETGKISPGTVAEAVASRDVFPVYFGSALRLWGVEELLDGLVRYTLSPEYPEEFGARVIKISRDRQGNRLTHLKVTGGSLTAKQVVGNEKSAFGEDVWEEKADQLRIYNGDQFQTVPRVTAGGICAVTGLAKTFAGQGLGYESENSLPSLEPVLTYGLKLPEGSDPVTVLGQMRKLEEEEPLLHVVWKESLKEIHVQVMGEVQIEILKNLMAERLGLEVEFENGSIVYKETLAEPVLGVGHFEPLRHYAEVQLLIEPGERGSGLQFTSYLSEDELDRNWQRLILSNLEERSHAGVLTGSEVTDLRISLVAGRAHLKHTEGGDFRQAACRALRQGLRSGKSVLLEPVFSFSIDMPTECLGRAMTDVQRMGGRFEPPQTEGGVTVLKGVAPVAAMRDYQREVVSYTKGMGRLTCVPGGYEPCREAEQVIRNIAYDPEADTENPASSVFCAHGAGFVVPWERVPDYAHLPLREDFLEAARRWQERIRQQEGEGQEGTVSFSAGDLKGMLEQAAEEKTTGEIPKPEKSPYRDPSERYISQEEIDAIFAQGRKNQNRKESDRRGYRRYHRGNRREGAYAGQTAAGQADASPADGGIQKSAVGKGNRKASEEKEDCLLVDGYNVIFSWPELREPSKVNIDSARDRLTDEMCNYQGYIGGTLILVYDAYKVRGNPGSVQKVNNIYVVYTKEAETADQYIEKTVHKIASHCRVTVATSDGLEQMIIWGEGAVRMSSLGLLEDLRRRSREAKEKFGIMDG